MSLFNDVPDKIWIVKQQFYNIRSEKLLYLL